MSRSQTKCYHNLVQFQLNPSREETILDYASCVWDPHLQNGIDRVHIVQCRREKLGIVSTDIKSLVAPQRY